MRHRNPVTQACPELVWEPAASTVSGGYGQLHLWKWTHSESPQMPRADWDLLAPEEQERARQGAQPGFRARFVANRAWIRRILGGYLHVAPEHLIFGCGPQGKPYLTNPCAPVHFNFTHSGAVALLAVGWESALGVDLEQVRPRQYLLAIARRLFSPSQAQYLETLPEPERLGAFYALWTGLEAGIKARGTGLFNQIPTSIVLGSFAMRRWHFIPHGGFIACLAAEGSCPAPSNWRAYCPSSDWA